MNINQNYLNLSDSYLFSRIAKRVREYSESNPNKSVIKLGIGDVTKPLVPAVISAMQKAVLEMGNAATFKGYGEEQGYLFLREAVCGYYSKKGVTLDENEVFISDGAKSDLGNILGLFSNDNTVLIPNPVYPVYVDTNIMSGRNVVYINGNEENGFLPLPDKNVKADIIYLCSPNNPTGAVYNNEQLKVWVDYALENNAVILYDAAYEIFIRQETDNVTAQTSNLKPSSIYQIDGAKECAFEFCSLSKTAGFTGTRCGYTVIPRAIVRGNTSLNSLWLRRQTTKFNGVPYIVQRGAEAVFSDEGMAQIKGDIAYYLENARMIAACLRELDVWFTGGEDSPYIWLKCFNNMSSWEFFDDLLNRFGIVGTPGAGFGACGEGYFRLSAFGERANVSEAMARLKKI
ncbi:MAG: LL-diaminopimelate aminotransferase [Oscillospiraceae bacterium]|nr:LL-diaminopimelate aminotransferase [Oscillospiraceae bacterium]